MADVHVAAVAIKLDLAGDLLHGNASAIVFQFRVDLPGDMDSQIDSAPPTPSSPAVEQFGGIVHSDHPMVIVSLEQDLRFSHPPVAVGGVSVEYLVRLDHNLSLVPTLDPKVSPSVFNQHRSPRVECCLLTRLFYGLPCGSAGQECKGNNNNDE